MKTQPTSIPGVDAVAAHWPVVGSHQRNAAYLALCGALCRVYPVELIEAFVIALAEATHDEEVNARVRIVRNTAARLADGEPCQGWPSLAKIVGPDAALSIRVAVDCALTLDALAVAKQLPSDSLRGLGVADAADYAGHVEIVYRDASGKVVAVRKRHSLGSKPRWEKDTKAIAYGEDRLADAVDAGYLTLCEGESDAWTLWHHGFHTLGIPGAECARVLQAGHVSPFKTIYVVQEGDAAGAGFVDGVAHQLAELHWRGELRVIRMTEKRKDVSTLYVAAPEQFKERWQKQMDKAEPIDLPSINPIAPAPLTYQPFPVDALPAPLAAFVREGAEALGCDASYFALPVLTVAASLIGNSRVILLKRNWTEPSVVWSAVIGESGTLKSPAHHLAVAPVHHLQRELLAAYREEKQTYEKVREEYERAAKQAKKDGKPLDDMLSDPPAAKHVISTNTTIESVHKMLADSPRGLLVSRDELRGWLDSFRRYRGPGGGSDLQDWLTFFRAEPLKIDRKTGDCPILCIARAAVSVCGSIQPGTLARALTPEHMEAGLAARLLVAMPPQQPKRWTEAEINEKTQQRYETLLRQLFAIKLDTDERGEPEPFVLRLTPEAKAAWVSFYEEWAAKQADAEGSYAPRCPN